MTAAIIAASSSIIVAVLAFVLNQIGHVVQERRQTRLKRIDHQLRDFYGPLNAMVDVNERIWAALKTTEMPDKANRTVDGGDDHWRRWRNDVLQPSNRMMRDLIFARADLLVDTEVPAPLRDFCAHVAAQEVVGIAEAEGVKQRALIEHPGSAFVVHVRSTYLALKKEQATLLRGFR